jgi:hypothetical protein
MSQGNTGVASPVNNTIYIANSVFGNPASQIGSSGWYCVYEGIGVKGTISGLTPLTNVQVHVCEFNLGSKTYNTSTASGNPASAATFAQLAATVSVLSDVQCYGGNNGSAAVSATGGNPSYSYEWSTSPLQTSEIATGLSAGIYTVTVTDGVGATVISSTQINQPTILVANAFQSKPVTCSADGIATVTASDGTPDYTYSWNTVPVQTTDMATGLTAGIYMVTVTDFNGCTMTATAAVEQLPGGPVTTIGSLEVCDQLEFTLPLTVDNFSEVGAINLTFSYNTAYLQVMGVTNNLIPADWAPDFNYSVSGKVTIAAFGGTTAFSLPDASDLVYVTFKALEPVTSTALTWNELPPTACEYGTQFGEFVYCRNPFGDYFKNGNVKINPVITAGITTHTDVQCFGSSSGSATVTVAGGNSAYSYYWNSTPPQYSNVASGLSAGIYAVQVSDAGSCAATATVEILQPSGPLSVSISQINPVTCAGGSNGSATVSAEGGWSSAYTYLWNDGQNTPTAALLTAGTYTVTVTDANSCVATASALINEMRAGPVTTITNVTVCSGATTVDVPVKVSSFNNVGGLQLHLTYDNTKLTVPTLVPGSLQPGIDAWGTWLMNTATPGTIVLSAYGLVPTDGVTLADGATLFSVRFDVVSGATSSTITFDENVQGTFCEYTDVAPGYTPFCDIPFVDYYKPGVVTIIPVLTANIINHTNIHCYGSNNGSATVSASGGTSSYSYLWNTVPAQITNVASGLTAGTYTVTVTDGSTCASATASVTLTQPQALSIVIAHTNLQCFGANNGTATVTVTGGTTPYSYDWNTSPVQHGNPATGLAAGSYTVTVTDANTCTITSTVEITGPAALSVPISHVDVTCFGGNDGSATVTVSGGSTPYSYLWNDAAAQTSYMATGLIAGTYVVSVTDVCSVNATATAVITQPAQVTVNAGPDQSLCQQTYAVIYGDPQPAGVWSQVSGANPVFFYYIPALNGYLVYGIQMADSVPYVFKFTVTVGSCSYSDTMKLYNFHYPSVPYAGTDKNVCLKSYPLNVVIMNGTHPLYGSGTWTPVAGTPPHTIDSIHNPHTRIWYTDPGTYKFLWTVTNGACNSPLNNDTCVITVYAPLDVNAGPDAVVCGGSPYYISGSSGTTDPCVTRLWKTSGTGTFNFTNILHPIYTPSPADILAGHVTLTIKDSIGCCSPCGPAIDEDFMVLTFSPPPVLTLSVTNVDCNGSNSGSITASVTSGGVPPYSYLWNNSQTAATATGLTAGTYSVTVTDANTCSAWASAVITEPSKLSIVSSVITNVNCYTYNTGIISLTADGGVTPYNYLWNNAQTTNVATGLTAGTYTVTVSDAHSCSLIQTWSVTQPEAWSIGINGPTSACCNLNAPYSNAVYTATVGGSYLAPVTYQWAVEGGTIISGQNTISITVNWSCCTNGKVWLTVTDSKPCVLTTFIPIVISPVPAPIITGPQEVTAGQANTQYCTPDYAGHLYSWTVIGGTVSSGQGTHCITVTWGAYPSCGCGSVSVSETFNGCTGTYTLPISIIPGLNVDIAGYMSYDNVYQTRLNGVALQLRNSSNAIVGNTVTINNPANGEPGYYAFTNVPNGTYSISGSYNGTWGGNNATDALLVQLFVLSSYPMNAFQQIVADVNASLTISGLDALYIKLRTVGSITSYPAGDWKIKDTTFTSPNTSLNLTALCFGDVNNSFIPMGYKETTFLSLIEDGVMRVPVSEPFTYDIHSSREAELGAMTLFLGYDQDRFEVIDITSNSEGLKYSFGNGKIAVAWSDTKPMKVNTNDLLLSLNMRTKDKITEPSRVFHIQPGSEFTDVLANPYDNFDLKMPNVVTPGGSQEISLYNYPNPFSGTTNIVYTLPESGHATLVLTDLYGHTIRTLVDQTENAGSYTVTVDPAGLNMTPGVYLYKIIFDSSTDTYVKVNKMVFTR